MNQKNISSLERQIFESLQQNIARFKSDPHYPYNLRYQEVIDFIVRTSLLGATNDDPEIIPLIKGLITSTEYVYLNMNHLRTHGYYYTGINVGSEKPNSRSDLNQETIYLLSKIYHPIESWNLMDNDSGQIVNTSPSNNNLYNDIFYFIYSFWDYSDYNGMDDLEFKLFKRLPGSHFIDLASFKRIDHHAGLRGFLRHDLSHLSRFLIHVFVKELLLILNSDDKEKYLSVYLQREAMLQGAIWQSIDDFFKNHPHINAEHFIQLFVNRFFNLQHEHTFGKTGIVSNNYSPTSYRSIRKFLKVFYKQYNSNFKYMEVPISFENFRNGVTTEFKKHLQEIPRNILLRKY